MRAEDLEAEYCPPLDPALFSAIVSDYNLENAHEIENARQTLDQLRESALLEEAAGFDPSGTGARDADTSESKRAESCPETNGETDLTSVSNGLSSIDLEEDEGTIGRAEDLEALDDDTKIRLLQGLFGDHVNSYTIQYTLKKNSGKWQASMEELLNHVYLDEAQHSDDGGKVATKGIDAFFEGDGTAKRARRGKTKGKKSKGVDEKRAISLPTSPGADTPTANKWQAASEDVEFIASRTRIATATVSSVYYENGASVPNTIGALLKASMEESKHIVTDDDAVAEHARQLGQDFPGVAPKYLATIVRLTYPATTAAHELATALTVKPQPVQGGGIQIIPRYASPVDSTEVDWQRASKKTRSANGTRFTEAGDGPSAAAQANAYAAARATAFSQASAAHRKAKSNPLMGGAAAYYSQLARDYQALGSIASAAAADELADSQSTATQLDLHGVDVLNAVRIAQEKVEAWWRGLGERRVNGRIGAGDRAGGYRIIVGLGRHSEGGKGKLGPAVSKALKQEGWRVEAEGASLLVKGKASR